MTIFVRNYWELLLLRLLTGISLGGIFPLVGVLVPTLCIRHSTGVIAKCWSAISKMIC
jgi:MFS family permease